MMILRIYDDDIDLETSVFVKKEAAVHERARPSDEKLTSMTPKGASISSVDEGTSQYKAIVLDDCNSAIVGFPYNLSGTSPG